MSQAGKTIWRSADVEAYRGFEYYRDGICQSFMDLRPEPDGVEDWSFSGMVETIPVGEGRLNRVVATSHLVLRTRAEIARSPGDYFYLNYKTRGECRIRQSDEEVVIGPGDVGLFASNQPFALEHRRRPDLAVSSFMLPFDALARRMPQGLPNKPSLISGHGALGPLIREMARTLACEIDHLEAVQATQLYDMMVDVVALALGSERQTLDDVHRWRADAVLLSAKSFIRAHHADIGLDTRRTASALGISVRYLHKLFEGSGQTFRDYLMEQRLQAIAATLSSPTKARMSIAAIALAHGFSDPSHFYRAFKQRYGCTAGEWRFPVTVRTGG